MCGMVRRSAPGPRLRRHHGADQHHDRCELERAGWRTTLEYRENHVRGRDGMLLQLQVVWCAEAERDGSPGGAGPTVITATGSTLDKVWSRLRTAAELADVKARRERSTGGARTASAAPAGAA